MAKPNVVSWLMEDTLIPDYHYVLLKYDFSDFGKSQNGVMIIRINVNK